MNADQLEQALCRGKTARFFLHAFEPLAKATCEQCPVRVQCLVEGRDEQFGIFGGLNPQERARIARKRRRAA